MNRAYPEAERLVRRALDLQADYSLALLILGMVLAFSRRVTEAIPVAERVVALSRAPMFVGLLGRVYGLVGWTNDLARLEHELEERRSSGEYITPVSGVHFAMGRCDGALIRRALEDCLVDNTSFTSLRAYIGPSLDEWRADVAIDALLQQLGGVRPSSTMKVRT